MTKLLAPTLACLALALVACGGGDSSSGDNSSGSQHPAASGGAEVKMENVQFTPADVTVKAGQTITFTNTESIPHDVHKTSGPGGDFASGESGGMGQGDTFKLKLDQAGKYEYVCNVHSPGMAGTITVK
ncbi:MAG TPA: plastocyanin/azurin family copper-binding protein [Thermoleophilaceae bacterium]|nr:plastocyanin/azurin family copper-binding protein [Thermoleophilaceae bacterium]